MVKKNEKDLKSVEQDLRPFHGLTVNLLTTGLKSSQNRIAVHLDGGEGTLVSGLEKVESAKISWNQRDLSLVPSPFLTLLFLFPIFASTWLEIEI